MWTAICCGDWKEYCFKKVLEKLSARYTCTVEKTWRVITRLVYYIIIFQVLAGATFFVIGARYIEMKSLDI